MSKCPRCGFNLKRKNYTPEIGELLERYRPDIRKEFNKLFVFMREYQPITAKEIYYFLNAISDTDPKTIIWAVRNHYSSGAYKDKNLIYLASIILNHNKNKEKIRQIQEKIYGTNPPERKVE
jgi:hypothetical protein